MSSPSVFLAEDLDRPAEAVTVGEVVVLGGAEGHHAAGVKRIGVSEELHVVDGKGLRLQCTVLAVEGKSLRLRVDVVGRDAVADFKPQMVLVQGLAKNDRDEQAVESATELGVDRVIPWQSDRAIVRWSGIKAVKGQNKWKQVARAAMKQSRRSVIPTVQPVITTRQLADQIRQACLAGALVFILHEAATVALMDQIQRYANSVNNMPNEVWLLVGPEGGISDDELQILAAAGGIIVRLGPHVMRSSTAGPAAIAVIGSLTGLWNFSLKTEKAESQS